MDALSNYDSIKLCQIVDRMRFQASKKTLDQWSSIQIYPLECNLQIRLKKESQNQLPNNYVYQHLQIPYEYH